MRTVAGFTLAGLGLVLIAAAVLLPTYVTGQIVRFPLDPGGAGIVGAVALVAGILLLVRKPRQAQAGPGEPSRHLAAGT
jgi:hypothetical protein